MTLTTDLTAVRRDDPAQAEVLAQALWTQLERENPRLFEALRHRATFGLPADPRPAEPAAAAFDDDEEHDGLYELPTAARPEACADDDLHRHKCVQML